jgi:hypothetical protein
MVSKYILNVLTTSKRICQRQFLDENNYTARLEKRAAAPSAWRETGLL